MEKLAKLFEVPGLDPEDQRRRKLLNILLTALAVGSFLILIIVVFTAPLGIIGNRVEVQLLVHSTLVIILGGGMIYVLNRYVSGKLASVLFLLPVTFVAAFSDEPHQVVNGRGLLIFTIPIFSASFLLCPWASFCMAFLSSLVIGVMGVTIVQQQVPNVPAMLSFFVLALVSWISARSLELALKSQRESQERLRKSEDRLSKIMLAANDGLWDWDLTTDEVYFNPRYYEMAGYEVNAFPHRLEEFQNRVHPDHIEEVMEQARLHLQGEIERFIVEFRFQRKQGEWMWILGRGVIVERDNEGTPTRFVGTHTDITERKRAEERFRVIFESAPDAYYLNDLEGRFVDGNKAAQELTGYSKAELVGKTFRELQILPEEQIPKALEILSKNQRGIQTDPAEFTLIPKDGPSVHIEICAHPVQIEGKTRVLGIARDITERKKAEQELTSYKKSLEELVKDRTQDLKSAIKELESFTYSVSHDLRAPLRHIDSFVQLLMEQEGQDLSPVSQRYLRVIADSANRMGHLIDDLLHFSRTSRLEIQCRRVDSRRIIDAVLKENDFLTGDRNVALELEPLREAYADPGLMRIVWTNLISNALKFTTQRDPARIHIGCLSWQEARQMLQNKTDKMIREDQNQVVFFIQDNGVGFDQQYANKLFGVFQRLHQNDEFEGTGIGLAIVKQIIRRHGGSVWAEGRVNEGATFYFSLEAYEADKPSLP